MERLAGFRKELNEIDASLIELLGRRFQIIRDVGAYKREANIPMMQSKRVDEVKDRCAKMGKQYDLDGDFIRNLYTLIIDEACRIEDIIIDKQ
jgi:chorismate mutase